MNPVALAFIIVGSIIVGLFLLCFIPGAIIVLVNNNHKHLYVGLIDMMDHKDIPPEFEFQKDKEWFNQEGFFKQISITSYDKKTLNGFFHQENSDLYVVFAHGYTGNPSEKARCLHELHNHYHCNILSFEQRAHGNSKIKYCTMGYREGKDIVKWTDYIKGINSNAQIIVFGESMGAATVLCGLGYGYNENVVGVIEDSSFSSIPMQYEFVGHNFCPKWLVKFVVFGTSLAFFVLFGMRVYKRSPVKAIQKKTIPICFIQGKKDSIVPYQSHINFQKNVHPETHSVFETFETADHVASFYAEPERYLKILFNFIDNSYKNKIKK